MKIQKTLEKPATLDLAIRKYLMKDHVPVSYPKGVFAIGGYTTGDQDVLVYRKDEELVFDLRHLGHSGVSTKVRNTMESLESYLLRTGYRKPHEQIILKYTKYWD